LDLLPGGQKRHREKKAELRERIEQNKRIASEMTMAGGALTERSPDYFNPYGQPLSYGLGIGSGVIADVGLRRERFSPNPGANVSAFNLFDDRVDRESPEVNIIPGLERRLVEVRVLSAVELAISQAGLPAKLSWGLPAFELAISQAICYLPLEGLE
jgi:hypothetical protein